MKVLQHTLSETRELHDELKLEGILPSSVAQRFQADLKGLEEQVVELRNHTYKCTSAAKEIVAIFEGLWTAISRSTGQVLQLRENLVVRGSNQRLIPTYPPVR
ncbi:hypothetical protein DXG03_005778 [Asterophora parasitica]|uniref:Uncharacterized protein n=1 Tax=Asterophora parasitica TaxID=117018 RepID=A0A9P7G1E1_9AGAR|nr:hypothetical protein DXG03_005778 [Asterophora parasitica]